MVKKRGRAASTTLLIIGEGATEKAFLDHLKSIYIQRGSGLSVTVRKAFGGSPENIVRYTSNIIRNAAYDKVAILMDTDVPWTDKTISIAQSKKIILIGSKPCIEGMLLKICGVIDPPQLADICKLQCTEVFSGDLTHPRTYKDKITRDQLDHRREEIVELNILLNCFCL